MANYGVSGNRDAKCSGILSLDAKSRTLDSDLSNSRIRIDLQIALERFLTEIGSLDSRIQNSQLCSTSGETKNVMPFYFQKAV